MVGFFSLILKMGLWLYVLQLFARIIFIFHRGNGFSDGAEILAKSTFHGFALDISMVGYLFVVFLFFIMISAAFKSQLLLQIWKWFFVILAFSIFIIAFADAELYRVWGSRFNAQALEYMRHPREAMASSSEAYWGRIIIISVLLSVAFYYWINRIFFKYKKVQSRWIPLIISPIFMVSCAPVLRGGFQTIPINQSAVYYSANPFHNQAAVNGAWNLMYYVVNPQKQSNPEAYKFGLNGTWYQNYFGADSIKKYEICNTKKPNVVIIILESYSAYVSNYFRQKNNASPFFDSLAKTGLSFTRAYSQGDRTDKGLAAVLSGWPGQPWQSILSAPEKAAKLPSLAALSKSKGYNNYFFYGGDAAFGNMAAYLRNTGFERIVDEKDFKDEQKGSKWGAHDVYLLKKAADFLQQSKQPFFATILTLSSHEPYEIPDVKNTGDELTKYFRSIRYTDDCLKDFFTSVRNESWFQNTLFVLVADHGRNLGLPAMDFFQPRHFEVPIVIWGPVLEMSAKGKIDSNICGQTDIAETLNAEVFHGPANLFPWGRRLNGNHTPAAFFAFSNGFGYVGNKGAISWGNDPAGIMEKTGKTDSMLLTGKSLQYEIIKMYQKF